MTVAFARYKAQGQKAPAVGTPQYTQLRDQAVSFLVQEEELQQEADKLGVKVSQKDVEDRLALIKKTYYHNSEKQLEAALKKDDITIAELEQYNLKPTLLSEKLQAKVTSNVKVTPAAAQKYYDQNKASFTTPKTREVRHILVNSKNLADQIVSQLKGGGWNKIIGVTSKKDGDNVNVYLLTLGDQVAGLAVVSIEPKEFTVVNIVGPVNLEKLTQLEGSFGVPVLNLPPKSKTDK